MTFNIHITRIGDYPTSGNAARLNQVRTIPAKQPHNPPSLVNVPAERMTNKYPVRILELQTEE